MTLLRNNPKRDVNEPHIIKALKDLGCSVYRLSMAGLPDLLCFAPRSGSRWARVFLVEVKADDRGRLTGRHQKTFHETAQALGWPVVVIHSETQVLPAYNDLMRTVRP